MISVTYPMISPATRPKQMQENTSMKVCVVKLPSFLKNWKESRHAQVTRNSPGIRRIVETTSWFFRLEFTLAVESTYCPYVIIALVTRDTSTPTAGMHRTKTMV